MLESKQKNRLFGSTAVGLQGHLSWNVKLSITSAYYCEKKSICFYCWGAIECEYVSDNSFLLKQTPPVQLEVTALSWGVYTLGNLLMTSEARRKQSAHGLKPDCLPFGEVLAQSIAVIAPTTIPASNLGLIVAISGNGTWLSFLIGLIGLTFVSININQFASRSASPGSLYSYIAKGLGPTAGVLCGWSLVLAYLFTGMSVLCGFANFSQMLLGHLGIHPSSITLLAIGAGVAWYTAYKDIKLSAMAMLWLEGLSIALILTLGIVIWAHKGFALMCLN